MGNINRIFSFTFSENHEATNAFQGWKELKQKLITFNILILGQTESGKSTLLNQIRRFAGISEKLSGVIFYEKKTDNLCFNKTELNAYQKFIDKNVLEATMSCLNVMKEKNLFFDEDQNQKFADWLLKENPEVYVLFAEPKIKELAKMWDESIINSVLRKYDDVLFHIPDGNPFLLFPKNLTRYSHSNLSLNEEDIIHCYRKTTVFAKTIFQFENLNIQFFDTDGQFPKQSNKFNQFIEKNETKLVIYVVSLSEYNQNGKLMEESLKAFEKAIAMKDLKDLPWIIVFNKLDILEQKEVKFPMRYYFDDFQDDMDSVKYLAEKYLEKIKTLEHKVEILWCYDQNGVVRIIKLIEEYITKFVDKSLYM